MQSIRRVSLGLRLQLFVWLLLAVVAVVVGFTTGPTCRRRQCLPFVGRSIQASADKEATKDESTNDNEDDESAPEMFYAQTTPSVVDDDKATTDNAASPQAVAAEPVVETKPETSEADVPDLSPLAEEIAAAAQVIGAKVLEQVVVSDDNRSCRNTAFCFPRSWHMLS